MELLIVINVILLLILIGTYLSLSGRVKHLEDTIRRYLKDVTDPVAEMSSSGAPGSDDEQGQDAASKSDDAQEPETAGPTHPATSVPGQVRAAQPFTDVPDRARAAQPPTEVPGQVRAGDGTSRLSHMLRPRTREEWETLIGGKLLNRVGALALVLGVGFFLKYAFDNNWLNETARVVLGGAAGLLLTAGGHRFHRRGMSVFAQGLTGAGVGILYLSIYAAYDFYRLVPQPAAFLLMALVTAAALLLSLRYDARAIALLGWAGGFLTPFLLVTAQLNTLGLFVYITLLDAGLIAVLLSRRHWRVLEPLGIAATYATYLTWSFRADLPEGFATALAFLVLWWALFAWLSLYRSAAGDSGRRRWRWIAVTVNALGFYVMLMRLSRHTEGIWDFVGIQSLTPQHYLPYSEGIATAVLSLAYFALTAWITRNTDDRSAAAVHATAAILLAVRAPLSFFTPYVIVVIWAFEALTLFGYGAYRENRAVRHAGTALLALSFAGIFLFGGAYVSNLVSAYVPVFSSRTAAYWVVGGALLACAGMLRGSTESKSDRRHYTVFHLAWTFLLLVWGTVEVLSYFRYLIVTMEGGSPEQLHNLRQLAVSGAWLFGAALVMALGRWQDIPALRAAAIVYLGCTVVKVFVFDLMFLDTLYRIVAFLGLSAILIAVSYLYYRNRPAS
ncbi:MAG: DUF2339 domain-containing protein [Gemmatimonadetes bacterium]|nr:DUF2339 domain-containing protein [Gemmatimonadota bacterium]MYG85782.1 DUF2339 domain-containing protein [Gemmatimonadota bacterium]MYJ90062.1 DUF2339 domain-containing protein [Gemmatimonadota bacterium]